MFRAPRYFPTLALVLLVLLVLAQPAAAHQCVDVTITSSPSSGDAGGQIAVSGTVENCGDPASGFDVSWILAGNGRRITLSSQIVVAAQGETVAISDTLFLPANLSPGDYTLVLKGVAPSTFTDTDRAPLTVN